MKFLKKNFIKAILISMIITFMSTPIKSDQIEKMYGIRELYNLKTEEEYNDYVEFEDIIDSKSPIDVHRLDFKYPIALSSIVAAIVISILKMLHISGFIALVITHIICWIIYYSLYLLVSIASAKFFITNNDKESFKLKELFLYFKKDKRRDILKTLYLRDLYIFGAVLLASPFMVNIIFSIVVLIPAIMLYIDYIMVDFILVDSSGYKANEILEKSEDMIKEYKKDIIILFIPLVICLFIQIILGQIGRIITYPYIYALYGQLYLELSKRPMDDIDELELI